MGRQVPLGDPGLGLYIDEDPPPGSGELEAFFAPGGYLSQALDGYQMRDGQVAFARQIEEVVGVMRHLLAEAPCGIGKSVGYLVPAILRVQHLAALRGGLTTPGVPAPSPPTVVVVTAGIALQEQLVDKDLPLLQRVFEQHVGTSFTYGLLKGWNNYLCPAQMMVSDVSGGFTSSDNDEQDQIDAIRLWAGLTHYGDRSELSLEPTSDVWRRFSIQAVECAGKHCSLRADCPAMRAKRRALGAQVIVTNYHMLAAHVRLVTAYGGSGIFGDRTVLILDEAHECTDIMRDALGGWLNHGQLRTAFRVAGRALGHRDAEKKAREKLSAETFRALNAIRASGAHENYIRVPLNVATLPKLIQLIETDIAGCDKILADERPHTEQVLGAATRGIARLRQAIEVLTVTHTLPESYVLSFEETRDKATALRVQYLDPSEILTGTLFRTWDTVIATSATVTSRGSFAWVQNELGAPVAETEKLTVESPFDFQSQGLLVLPEGIPEDTNTDAFRNSVAHHVHRTVLAARGRTLCLFTSYRNMRLAAEQLLGLPYPVFAQGDMPRSALIARFRDQPDAVLLGVASMWTGIDVVGESLSCLFIDKLPFPMMSDPIMNAIQDRDKDWFRSHSLPRTIIRLKQGVGRLIRAATDRGVCVILDPRLRTKGYGKGVLRSLPPMQRSTFIEDISGFLDTGTVMGDTLPF